MTEYRGSREGQEDREFMASVEADVVRRLPAAMDKAFEPRIQIGGRPVNGILQEDGARRLELFAPEWTTATGAATEHFPGVDPMDVTWPDGTYKVFPDRTWGEHSRFNVDMVAPDTRDMWARIQAEVAHRRLEETILEELAAIITERGKDAPGILIIKTPDGQWAIKESEWLAPGSAVLSTMDQPDLMAVAQGDGWLYYRQGPSWGEQAGVPDTATVDIMPDLPGVSICPDCGFTAPEHRFGCNLEWEEPNE